MVTEKFAGPCCGYKTFIEQPNGNYDICEVCFWEDDPIQLDDPNYEGGANRVSLRQGQKNFIEFGACEIEMIKNVIFPKFLARAGFRLITAFRFLSISFPAIDYYSSGEIC